MGPEPRSSQPSDCGRSRPDTKSETADPRGLLSSQVIFDPPTRSRRRVLGRLFWPLLIVAIVAIAVVVSSEGEETRAELDYLEEMRTQLSSISRDGDSFRDVVSRLRSIERVEFETVIDTMRDDLAEAITFSEETAPSNDLVSIAALYRLALRSWDAGLEGFGDSVLLAADQPRNLLVLDNLAGALAELKTGDALYEDLVGELNRTDTPNALGEMPDVRLIPGAGPVVNLSGSYIQAARADGSRLALRPGLAISQIISDPEWEVNPNSQAVVPSTTEISFSIVITNLGNVASEPATLVLVLSGGAEAVEVEAQIASLDPNEQTTITFSPMSVTPGGSYQVDANLPPTTQDSDLTDNDVQVQFTINE